MSAGVSAQHSNDDRAVFIVFCAVYDGCEIAIHIVVKAGRAAHPEPFLKLFREAGIYRDQSVATIVKQIEMALVYGGDQSIWIVHNGGVIGDVIQFRVEVLRVRPQVDVPFRVQEFIQAPGKRGHNDVRRAQVRGRVVVAQRQLRPRQTRVVIACRQAASGADANQ